MQFATLFAFLILVGTQQVCVSSHGGDNCARKQNLLSQLDKAGATVRSLLTSQAHIETLERVEKSFKDFIHNKDLDSKSLDSLEDCVKRVSKGLNDGEFGKDKIIQFLENDPMKKLEEWKRQMFKS